MNTPFYILKRCGKTKACENCNTRKACYLKASRDWQQYMIMKYDFNDLYNNQLMSLPDLKKYLESHEGYKIPGYPLKLLELQGVKTRTIGESTRTGKRTEKIKSTCLERYGATNVLSKGTAIFDKRNKTVKEKYGCDNVFQTTKVKNKIKETMFEHFGENFRQIVYQRFSDAYLKKIGYDNPFKNPDIIKKIWEKRAQNGNMVFHKRKISEPHKIVSDWLDENGFEHTNEDMTLHLEITHPDGRTYHPVPDIYLRKYNLIIEIYGNYWHANPQIYKDNDILRTFKGNILASEIRRIDSDRMQKIEQAGYNTLVLWESEINTGEYKEIFHKKLDSLSII